MGKKGDMVPRYSKTVIDTLVSGTMTKQMARENSGMPMETFTKDFGSMIKQRAMVFTLPVMARATWDSGRMINNMERAKKPGRTKVIMREPTRMARRMDVAFISTLTDLHMKGIGYRTRSRALELTHGQIKKFTQANG